jgi:sn-glycerol 3-phosphate transport system permease protein
MVAPATARQTRSRRTRDALSAYGLLLPTLVAFALFAFYPFWRLIHFALYQQNTTGTKERYVGPEQLVDTLTSGEFWEGVRVSTLMVVFSVPIGMALGVVLATAAHRKLRGIKFFQTVFASTIASSGAVTAVVFFTLVNPQIGYFKSVPWLDLEQPLSALFSVSLSVTWQSLGLSFIIVLAGLQTVPDELIEAATLDGFGAIRRFFRITVPLISPTLLFLAVVLVVRTFQVYAEIDILTGGGPAGATESLLFKITRLQQPRDLAEGAAMSLGLFVITLIVAGAQFGLVNRRVHYGE